MADIWCLEGSTGDRDLLVLHLRRFPFTIGRAPECDLVIAADGTSRRHSEISRDGQGRLVLRDLGSTNGTYLNRRRITAPALLSDGDIVHFGATEFRLRAPDRGHAGEPTRRTSDRTMVLTLSAPELELPEHFSVQERDFNDMLELQRIRMLYQPIVSLRDNRIHALELLGRGDDPRLPDAPERLFRIAAILGKEAVLSRALREAGVRAWGGVAEGPILFVNTHPHEMYTDELYGSLADLRQDVPGVQLVVEVNEKAVTDIARMRTMASRLRGLGVKIAFDDFGAGLARLNELSEITPDYLKFDLTLVHNLDQDERKQKMVGTLVQMSHDLDIVALAEGAETLCEVDCCRALGFDLLQGFAMSHPRPIESFLDQAAG